MPTCKYLFCLYLIVFIELEKATVKKTDTINNKKSRAYPSKRKPCFS